MGGAGRILHGARNKAQSLSEARLVLTMEPHPHLLNFILRQDLAKLHNVAGPGLSVLLPRPLE